MSPIRKWIAASTLVLVGLLAAPVLADQKPLDLNTASIEQLNALSGIGDSKARAIVAYRDEHGPFRSVDDLLAVKGIGDKLLASLKPQITVAAPAGQPAAGKATR